MEILPIIILILALGCDNFTVGITYGMRNIKIKSISLIMIGITAILTSNLGLYLTAVLSENIATYIGNILLIFIGIWLIYTTTVEQTQKTDGEFSFHYNNYLYYLKNPALLMKKIKYPENIRLFDKKYLSISETVIMSIALSFDAFSAGIGVGLSELNYFFTILIGIISPLFVFIGLLLGKKFGDLLPENFNFIPGIIIILIGIINLL